MMLSKIWLGVLALMLLVSACAGKASTVPEMATVTPAEPAAAATELPAQELQPTRTAQATATPFPATPTTELVAMPPVPSGCTVVTQQFSPEPTEQSIFPPVTSADWMIGPETAAVTLIEYGDFQ